MKQFAVLFLCLLPTMASMDGGYGRIKRSPLDLSANSRTRTTSSTSSNQNGYSFAPDGATSAGNNSGQGWTGNPREYTIGGVLSGEPGIDHYFTQILSDVEQLKLDNEVNLNEATQTMDTNPIKTAITVCSQLIQRKVYAIIVSKPQHGDLSPASVSYTAGFYHIPVIGISSRDSAFSDKNIHVSFLRTVPPYSHQANVWVEMLKQFKYRQLVFLHSSDTDGRALLGRFQTKTQDLQSDDQEVKVEKVEEFEPGRHTYYDTLMKIKECQARVYFLYASAADADQLFMDAARLNMTGSGYVWIVTEQALQSGHVPSGTLGLQLVGADSERAHISDSLNILAQALLELHKKENVTEAPSNCNTSGALWETGKRLFEYIRRQVLPDGKTGRVAFDEMGDRIYAEYQVVNVQNDPRHNFDKQVVVGNYKYSNEEGKMLLTLDEDRIVWPGGLTQKPTGLMIPTHLTVLTILEKPFVYSRPLPVGEHCDVTKGETVCPIYDTSKTHRDGEQHCCRGYCIDLLKHLADHCNFTYSLYLSFNEYGSLERNNQTGKQEWTGLIGELVNEDADLIVAPLTINPERAQVMEFSKPFKYQGITILQKRQPRASQLVSFLQPFKSTLWVLVLVSVHVVALCLYLLDRFSPFGRYQAASSSADTAAQKEESLNLTSAIWFAWGVLLNSGIGEGTPRSFSARVLGMVWAGFAMIIVASYTANLAAFLVLDKPQTSLTGINDPRLRNPMENFTYATVKGSAVDMYFRRQVELSNMYRTMEGKHYNNPEEAISAVKSGVLKAFIWDSSRLEFEAARDCDLITAGDLFGRSGYGVGLQKGSPWADKVTLAILDFHESGKMEDLDNSWILLNNEVECDSKDDNSPATLGLNNMRGVFILVGVGIVGGLGLIIIEIIFKKHQMRKQEKVVVARTAVSKWKGTIEKRRTVRESTKKLKSNGIRGSGTSGTSITGGGATTTVTPESVTLSVGSLPQRQMYPSDSTPWRSPSPPNPEQQLVVSNRPTSSTPLGPPDYKDLPPPPIPPHKSDPTPRPRSAMSGRNHEEQEGDIMHYPSPPIFYHNTTASHREWGGSRDRLMDSNNLRNVITVTKNGVRLHRSIGSGLEQHQNMEIVQPLPGNIVMSPSSSDSSRKRTAQIVVVPNNGQQQNRPGVPQKVVKQQVLPLPPTQSPFWDSCPDDDPPSQGSVRLKSPVEPDFLSSPEYPSTSSDRRHGGIPQPPPPPKLYYQKQMARQPLQQQQLQPRSRHHHAKDFVQQRRPMVGTASSNQQHQQQQQQQVYNRRHRGANYVTDDSDV